MQILCFGDSNTYGYDPRSFLGDRYDSKDRWCDLLAAQTGHTVINAGVNGQEVPWDAHSFRQTPVDILLIMLGTNDLLRGASAAETAARMDAFLTSLMPHCKKILLVTPPPMKRGAWVPTDTLVKESVLLGEEYRLLAKRLDIPFVDTRRWEIELTFDGVHFTEEGHHTFARLLLAHL